MTDRSSFYKLNMQPIIKGEAKKAKNTQRVRMSDPLASLAFQINAHVDLVGHTRVTQCDLTKAQGWIPLSHVGCHQHFLSSQYNQLELTA